MSLKQTLEENILCSCQVETYYFSTVVSSKECETTSHLLVSLQADQIIYAIEVLVYAGKSLTTLYVSKVDTTGCHDKSSSPISDLTYSFLKFLITSQTGAVRLSLFARSQPQYIFPCSSQNSSKHILDDRALVKWWIKLVDKLDKCTPADGSCYLLIPGFESIEMKRYLPHNSSWVIGHPYTAQSLAKDQIPNFPDDPKSRFLDQLEIDRESEHTTVADFWDQMAYRQEMSSGHAIGFISFEVVLRECVTYEPLIIEEKTYKAIYASLERQIYESAENVRKSTRLWLQSISSSKARHIRFDIRGQRTSVSQTKAVVSRSQNQKYEGETSVEPQINTLIPRKRVKKIHSVQT